ncbi:MAG TPA: hypothetical protein DHW63_03890 [Hyphomonadaceae bacterium]|nr:hypothetical protein [Hyphomonadaceae bacterium]
MLGDSNYSWRAKLERAHELTRTLEVETQQFLQRDPAPWVGFGGHSLDLKEFVFMAASRGLPPARFGVIAGEVIHHLRSSLDHIVWQLAVKKIGAPSPRLQFPIFTKQDGYNDALKRGALRGIGPAALAVLENLQPFKQPTPADTILAVVQELNNIDKHRLLVVLSTAAQIGNTIRIADGPWHFPGEKKMAGIVGMSPPATVALTAQGVRVFSIQFSAPAPGIIAHASVEVNLAFEKAGATTNFPVIRGLDHLSAGVSDTLDRLEALL